MVRRGVPGSERPLNTLALKCFLEWSPEVPLPRSGRFDSGAWNAYGKVWQRSNPRSPPNNYLLGICRLTRSAPQRLTRPDG